MLNPSTNHSFSFNTVASDLMERYELSAREAEILDLVVLQYSNSEIADRTNITRNTVKFHLKNLLTKLEVSTRQEAARKALFQLGR